MESQLMLAKVNYTMMDPELIKKAKKAELKPFVYLQQSISWQPLFDLIKPEPQWQKSFRSLQAVNPTNKTIKDPQAGLDAANSSRLTWRINFSGNYCALEAREQKIGKNKKWTAGRVVSLERLHENPGQFDYLTDQDKKMCHAIETEQEFQYYGRYAKVIYSASGFSFLKEAVDHPLLFLASEPKTSIEFAISDIVLEIQSKKSQFTLKMQP